MVTNYIDRFLLFALVALFPASSLYGQGECEQLDLKVIIKNENLEIPDSTIFCLLQESFESNIGVEMADFLGKRHYQSYGQDQYEHALHFAQFQSRVWNNLDSLIKYNYSLFRQSLCYYRLGNMFDSHRVITESIEIARKIDDTYNYANGHSRLAWIYSRLDRYEEAISAIKVYKTSGSKVFKTSRYLRFYHNAMGSFHSSLGEFEIARMHADSAIQIVLRNGDKEDYATYISNKANYYAGKDSIDRRLTMLRTSFVINKKYKNKINLSENYLKFSSLFLLKNEYDSSLHYLNKGFELYSEIDNKSRRYIALGLRAEVYDSLGDFKLAYIAKKQQYELNSELYGLAEVGQIFDLEKKISIQVADEKIRKLENEKKLKNLKIQRQRANLIIVALVFLGLIGLLYFYNYRMKQRKKIEQLLKAQDSHREKILLEKKALSAQMNPHFLFNSLNSIKSYIANREPRIATRYLNKFASLMRINLSFSEHNLISLAEEIKAIKLYTELEQFRLKDSFEFKLTVDQNLASETIYMPPLIIQPFVENAIWHGLVKKQGAKLLQLNVYQKDDRIIIHIKDNGIGREAAFNKRKPSHKSYGMKITQDRLMLFEGEGLQENDLIKINDLVSPDGRAAGTEVVLSLKIKRNPDEEA